MQIRVGLNSGEVVVPSAATCTWITRLSARRRTSPRGWSNFANPGSTAITPETLALVEGYVDVKSLGPVPVKGLADAVEIYEVTGAGPARTRLQAVARRGLTRFVGRDAELEQLRRALQLARNGRGLPTSGQPSPTTTLRRTQEFVRKLAVARMD